MDRLNSSLAEVEYILEFVLEYCPISGLEWDLITQCKMLFHPY